MTLMYRVLQLVREHGSYRAVAQALDIDPGYLYRLCSGEKTNPSPEMLRRLGLRAVVTYQRIEP